MSADVSEISFIIISVTLIMLLLVGFILFAAVLHRNKQLKNKQQITEIKAAHNQAVAEAQIEIHEQTLHYVGQELHDNLGQMLSLIKMNLSQPDAARIADAKVLLGQSITDLRALSQKLNLDWAKSLSFDNFIDNEINKIQRATSLKFKKEVGHTIDLTDQQNKLLLFRIIQEILHNIIKHAQATEVHIITSIDLASNKNVISIQDNGIGFSEDSVTRGAGLVNLKHRAGLISASINWDSKIGAGTQVIIQLPNH